MKNVKEFYQVDKNNLRKSFQDACRNQEFKDYVYNLNIEEEILIKYTSTLEDSYLEHKNCESCKNLDSCKNLLQGFCYTPYKEKNMIIFSYKQCKKKEKQEKEESYKKNLNLFELSEELKNATFKNMYTDDKARLPIIKYFKEFMEDYKKEKKPKGIYLTGSFGSGKTYLIASLFNEMAKKGISSILIYFPDFLTDLKSSFQTNFKEMLDEVKQTPLLLLDDIGAENVSNWSRDEILGPILQYRMENYLPTFFTSNLTLEELEKSLSITSSGVDKIKARRIIERMKQLTVTYELISKSRRG